MISHDNNTPEFPEEPDLMSLEDANKFLLGEAGDALYRTAISYSCFLVFGIDHVSTFEYVGHGSCFFVRSPTKLFVVTAAHVYEGFLAAKIKDDRVKAYVGDSYFDLEANVISTRTVGDPNGVDIATFDLSEKHLSLLTGKMAIEYWPPLPPQQDRGVLMVGFPKPEVRQLGRSTLGFGVYVSTNIVKNVTERHIEVDLQHRDLSETVVIGNIPDLEYNVGGMSGGPVFTIAMKISCGVIMLGIGGVISEKSHRNDSLFAENSEYIRADGKVRNNP